MPALDGKKGFTLIELAIVLVIVGLLVGMGVGLMGPMTKRIKLSETRSTVKEVFEAVRGYANSNKSLPLTLGALSTKTTDSYGSNLIYVPAGGITASDFCSTQGAYLTVNDQGTNKTNVAFIVFSQGENLCNDTGASTPFTILNQGVVGSCTTGYDDVVMYADIDTLRQQVCNSFRVVTDSLPIGTEEILYPSVTLQATDGTTPYVWYVSGQFQGTFGCSVSDYPITSANTGLCLSTGGTITATPPQPAPTPTADGTYNFTVTVTDAETRTASRSLSITINPNDPKINTDVLHYSSVGSPYNATIAASGGAPPYTWSLFSGLLPPGLVLSGNTISGNLITAGTYAFTLRIVDQQGRTATKALSIAVNN